jgi:ABC-type iron transport system FetAB permease component
VFDYSISGSSLRISTVVVHIVLSNETSPVAHIPIAGPIITDVLTAKELVMLKKTSKLAELDEPFTSD